MYNLDSFLDNRSEFGRFIETFNEGLSPHSLRCAKIKLTSCCNLRCRMCKYWRSSKGEELSTSEVIRVLDSLRSLGCLKVHFSGGEIFLRRDIFEILGHARALQMKVNLTTNGTLIEKSTADRLVRLKINSISFSIDGPSAQIHDRIRGVKGCYKRIMRGISHVVNALNRRGGKTKVRINTVLQRENYLSVPQIIEQAGQLGAVESKIIPVDGKCDKKSCLSKAQIREFNTVLVPEIKKLRKKYGFSTEPFMVYPLGKKKDEINQAKDGNYSLGYYGDHLCYVPWLHTFVTWNGNVFLCCMSRDRIEPMGNVKEEPLESIFRGERYGEARKSMKSRRFEFCHRCDDFVAENRLLETRMASLKQN